MKKLLIILFLAIYAASASGQSNTVPCITCDGNRIDFTKGASAIGTQNQSIGINSLAVGYQCKALGDYSIAMPFLTKAAGARSLAFGYNAVANGMGSIALGTHAQTGENAVLSISIGSRVSTSTNWAMVLGMGSDNNFLTNDIQKSFMVGFNSDLPTLFVGSSTGDGTTGRIGIGNITAPTAKLHIKADINEDAAIMLQATGSYASKIYFGDTEHSIWAKTGSNLFFETGSGNHAVFQDCNVGFGTNQPGAKIQVKDGDIFIEDIDRGIIMKSPDGNCWRGTVNNNGMLEFEQIDCETLETGINNPEPSNSAQIKIYPNPAGNQVFITCDISLNGLQLEINDINGQLISSQKLNNLENIINLNSFQPGTYLFRLTDKNGEQIAVEKVIKE